LTNVPEPVFTSIIFPSAPVTIPAGVMATITVEAVVRVSKKNTTKNVK
jgi:hypothetical protein